MLTVLADAEALTDSELTLILKHFTEADALAEARGTY